MIRIVLPYHLKNLAHVDAEVIVDLKEPPTLYSAINALEARYPVLAGTIRDHVTHERRPFIRFYACRMDLSNAPPDARLPDDVVSGKEPLYIIGAIAGG